MIRPLLFVTVALCLACSGPPSPAAAPEVATASPPEAPPMQPDTTPPAPPAKPPESVMDHYALLGDRVPALEHVAAWDRWIAVDDDADAPSSASWEAYAKEARYDVLVDGKNGYVRVRDGGTGGGSREWIVAMFVTASGDRLIGVSATDSEPEYTSSTASFLRWEGAAWKDITAEVAPELGPGLFFEGGGAGDAALVPIVELPQHGTTVKVRAVANREPPEGWKYAEVALAFDKKAGRFEVSARTPR